VIVNNFVYLEGGASDGSSARFRNPPAEECSPQRFYHVPTELYNYLRVKKAVEILGCE
jgi:hypothetical protein